MRNYTFPFATETYISSACTFAYTNSVWSKVSPICEQCLECLDAVKMHSAIMDFARASTRAQEEQCDASGRASESDGRRGRSLDVTADRVGGQKRENSASPGRSPAPGDESLSEFPHHKRKRESRAVALLGDVWDVLARRVSYFVDDMWTMGVAINFSDMDMELDEGDEDFMGNRCMFYMIY